MKLSSKTSITQVDACGLACPGPIIKLKSAIQTLGEDDIVEMTANDPLFKDQVKAYCDITGLVMHDVNQSEGITKVRISRGISDAYYNQSQKAQVKHSENQEQFEAYLPLRLDVKGLQGAKPFLKLESMLGRLQWGQSMIVEATDPAFEEDALQFCVENNLALISVSRNASIMEVTINKPDDRPAISQSTGVR